MLTIEKFSPEVKDDYRIAAIANKKEPTVNHASAEDVVYTTDVDYGSPEPVNVVEEGSIF